MSLPPVILAIVVSCAFMGGCASTKPRRSVADNPATTRQNFDVSQPSTAATGGSFVEALNATIAPPAGWRLDIKHPAKPNVKHYVWVSPRGNTAFGVMKFSLPLPTPHDPVLWIFLHEMRKSEGAATLLSKVWDRKLRGVRFDAEGGRYLLRTNFTIRGLTGWMSYAGTERDQPINEIELKEAELAREQMLYGMPRR